MPVRIGYTIEQKMSGGNIRLRVTDKALREDVGIGPMKYILTLHVQPLSAEDEMPKASVKGAAKKPRDRLDDVITMGTRVLATKVMRPLGPELEDERGYVQFRMSAQAVLDKLDRGGRFEREFQFIDGGMGNSADRLPGQLGVLEALRDNVDDGDDDDPDDEPEPNTAPEAGEGPLVFISCGQFTKSEIYLGKQIAKLVKEQTGAVGYFAQNQTSLDGLTDHIFKALDRAAGFIAVMHKRGQVTNPKGDLDRTRASVWIEQEIAIASFIQKTRNANLKVQAYIEEGIALEGAREKLMLNPEKFKTNAHVSKHLKKVLQTWQLQPPKSTDEPQVDVKIEKGPALKHDGDEHVYQLQVTLKNVSEVAMDAFLVELSFPSAFLVPYKKMAGEVEDKKTKTHRFFQKTNADGAPLLPGDTRKVLWVEYRMDDDLLGHKDLKALVQARVFYRNKQIGTGSAVFKDLQHF
jgi:hypothetical protein